MHRYTLHGSWSIWRNKSGKVFLFLWFLTRTYLAWGLVSWLETTLWNRGKLKCIVRSLWAFWWYSKKGRFKNEKSKNHDRPNHGTSLIIRVDHVTRNPPPPFLYICVFYSQAVVPLWPPVPPSLILSALSPSSPPLHTPSVSALSHTLASQRVWWLVVTVFTTSIYECMWLAVVASCAC